MRAAALLVLLAACGGGSDDDPIVPDADPTAPDAERPDAETPADVIMETVVLAPGELVEATLHGTPDDFAVLHLEAPSSELDWNIHGHADGSTQTVYEELNVMTVDYRFTPSAEADWSLLLRNSGPVQFEVSVRAELYHAMTWEWQ